MKTCSVAVAPCFAALEAPHAGADGAAPFLLQVTPAGRFAPNDGRAGVPAGGWCMDEADAARCIAAFDAAQPPVIDYEHQTLHAAANGQPAPAAGFMRALRWLPGRGMFAEVELTQRARQLIRDGEYRYFSPVFAFDTATGGVQRILMGALTNHPAISGMQPLAAAARAFLPESSSPSPLPLSPSVPLRGTGGEGNVLFSTTEETSPMNQETTAPPEETTAGALPAGVSAGVCIALGLPEGASEADAISACTALLKERDEAIAAAKAAPDPAKYAPVEALKDLQAQVAALTAEAAERMVDDLIAPALADGRLLPAQKEWAESLGKKDVAALKAFLDTAQPIAALAATQTGGKAPDAKATQLTETQAAVAAACGITPEAFAEAMFMAQL